MAAATVTEDKRITWLRAAVVARLETAKAACHGAGGHWWRQSGDSGHGRQEFSGGLLGGEAVRDADGDVCGGEHIVIYDEGRPSDDEFAHIAANDPQDTIARCEAELAIIAWHEAQCTCDNCTADGDDLPISEAYPCQTVRLIASAYRHKPGYQEYWGSGERARRFLPR